MPDQPSANDASPGEKPEELVCERFTQADKAAIKENEARTAGGKDDKWWEGQFAGRHSVIKTVKKDKEIFGYYVAKRALKGPMPHKGPADSRVLEPRGPLSSTLEVSHLVVMPDKEAEPVVTVMLEDIKKHAKASGAIRDIVILDRNPALKTLMENQGYQESVYSPNVFCSMFPIPKATVREPLALLPPLEERLDSAARTVYAIKKQCKIDEDTQRFARRYKVLRALEGLAVTTGCEMTLGASEITFGNPWEKNLPLPNDRELALLHEWLKTSANDDPTLSHDIDRFVSKLNIINRDHGM